MPIVISRDDLEQLLITSQCFYIYIYTILSTPVLIKITSTENVEVIQLICTRVYTQMVASNGAFSLIDKPTRITNTSQTIIDHRVTNDATSVILYIHGLLNISIWTGNT